MLLFGLLLLFVDGGKSRKKEITDFKKHVTRSIQLSPFDASDFTIHKTWILAQAEVDSLAKQVDVVIPNVKFAVLVTIPDRVHVANIHAHFVDARRSTQVYGDTHFGQSVINKVCKLKNGCPKLTSRRRTFLFYSFKAKRGQKKVIKPQYVEEHLQDLTKKAKEALETRILQQEMLANVQNPHGRVRTYEELKLMIEIMVNNLFTRNFTQNE